MAYYRIYCVDKAGRVQGFNEYECADDEAAYSRAVAVLMHDSFRRPCEAVEVWNLRRHVATIRRDQIGTT